MSLPAYDACLDQAAQAYVDEFDAIMRQALEDGPEAAAEANAYPGGLPVDELTKWYADRLRAVRRPAA